MVETRKSGEPPEESKALGDDEYFARQIPDHDFGLGLSITDYSAAQMSKEQLDSKLGYVEDLLKGTGNVDDAILNLINQKVVSIETFFFLLKCYDGGIRKDVRHLADQIRPILEGAINGFLGGGEEDDNDGEHKDQDDL